MVKPLEWELAPGDRLSDPKNFDAKHIDGGWYGLWDFPKGRDPDSPWRLSFDSEIIGTFDSAGEAKKFADEHHARTHRAALWAAYMADNDPPVAS